VNLGETLDEAAAADLGKLLKAAEETGTPIAAQIDYEGKPGIWRQLRRVGPTSKATEIRDANSANPEVLKEFLHWGRKQLQTDRYLLMLWGHGAGPSGFFSDASEKTPARVGHPLSPRLLSRALQSFRTDARPPFDILLAKACLPRRWRWRAN
jgi:hypothetical protein